MQVSKVRLCRYYDEMHILRFKVVGVITGLKNYCSVTFVNEFVNKN